MRVMVSGFHIIILSAELLELVRNEGLPVDGAEEIKLCAVLSR